MLNTENLDGMWCRECGSLGPFRISVTTMVLAYDDVVVDDKMGSDREWDDSSYCECSGCHHSGTVGEFRSGEHIIFDLSNDEVISRALDYIESISARDIHVPEVAAMVDGRWEIFDSFDDEGVLFKVRSPGVGPDVIGYANEDTLDITLPVEIVEDPDGLLPADTKYRIYPRSYKVIRSREDAAARQQ